MKYMFKTSCSVASAQHQLPQRIKAAKRILMINLDFIWHLTFFLITVYCILLGPSSFPKVISP